MTRHKSRVARRSRRRARRGTRKQSGGFSFPSLSSLNPFNWLFKKSETATGVVDGPTTTVAAVPAVPAVPAALPDHGTLPDQIGGRKKSRKTRHRRK